MRFGVELFCVLKLFQWRFQSAGVWYCVTGLQCFASTKIPRTCRHC